jgi:DNA-binding NarL/FixJ family response regulator
MKQSPDPITIITALACPATSRQVRQLIAGHTRFQLLGDADNGPELLRLVLLHHPHLVLTDLNLPAGSGPELCGTIRQCSPTTGIIALCPNTHTKEVMQVVQAGVSACLLQDRWPLELLPALYAVSEGRLYGNTLMKGALQQLHPHRTAVREDHFTHHELQVINLICRQLTGHEIAAALSVSLCAVEEIRGRLQEKLGVRSGVGIALYALRQGLVRVD